MKRDIKDLNKEVMKKYFTKPWYLHPLVIGILLGAWILFFIPALIGVILLFVNAKDNKRKRQLILDLNLDRLAELDILERKIKEKTLHDKSLSVLANLKKQYGETKKRYEILQTEIDSRTKHLDAIKTLDSTLNEIEKAKAAASADIKEEIDKSNRELKEIKILHKEISEKISALKNALIPLEEEADLQSLGFYGINFDTSTSAEYKTQMIKFQNQQKRMTKDKTACNFAHGIAYNGSLSAGKRMIRQNVKMALWSFNTHCDNVIAKVTYRNRDLSERKLRKAFEVINSNDELVSISYDYLELKIKELDATFKYKELLEHEKEILREQREQEREEKKLQQEIARERTKLEKDETHISTEIARLQHLLLQERNDKQALQSDLSKLEYKLTKISERKNEVDFREAHAKAGYVYVISNIGAFGSDVVKIGVTRRLEPIERINELGDASVPFRFDVHALIFSDQAYKLEKSLHDRFASKRVNQVNNRKEFFKVSLEEVREAVIKEFNGASVEFRMQSEAKEFRETVSKVEMVRA